MSDGRPKLTPRRAMIVAGLLAVLHAALAFHAASTKSPTFDEPVHAFGGFLALRFDDHRVNPEHPIAWKLLAAVFAPADLLTPDFSRPESRTVFANLADQWDWTAAELFSNDPKVGVRLINAMRTPMPLFGATLVLIVGWWSLKLFGPKGCVFSAALAALDPNLLGHAGLLTNDVAAAGFVALCSLLLWRVGNRASWLNVLGLAIAVAAAFVTKFFAILLPITLGITLIIRVVDKTPWPFFGRSLATRGRRAVAAILVTAACGITAFVSIWTVYGFRFSPSPDAQLQFDASYPGKMSRWIRLSRELNNAPFDIRLIDSVPNDFKQRTLLWAREQRLLPDAYLHGLAYAEAMSGRRSAFLDDHVHLDGRLDYFPKAFLYKSPITTILLTIAGVAVTLGMWRRGRLDRWGGACLVLPAAITAAVAMSSSMNIGVRHLFVVFPALFVAAGSLVALVESRRAGRWVLIGAVIALAVESLRTHPNELSFFNVVAGRPSNGLHRLSDSNLDWGQDLPALAAWQKKHPGVTLYVSYFGSVPPEAFDIDSIATKPDGILGLREAAVLPAGAAGVLAISATDLQGTFAVDPVLVEALRSLREDHTPAEVLNNTIYLYTLPFDPGRDPFAPLRQTPAETRPPA